jgi:alkyl hydroperoxide reductase subunit AhpC
MARFAGMNAQVLGISVDSVPCLIAWAKSLGGISYPLLSDFWPHGEVAKKYGVLRKEGYTERAIFIVDREGVIRYIDIHDIGQQPSNEALLEELRKIDPQAATAAPRAPQTAAPLPKGGIVMYCSK